ncbi:MAG TPA: GNAT family N-acetyltransferase, partial [Pyrinomonadaceae bacterium]
YPATGPIRAGVALQINSETIRPLSAPWADYHDGVGNPFDFEAVESLAGTLREFIDETGYALVLDDVVPGGSLERIARHLKARHSESNATAAIDLTDSSHMRRILSRKEYVAKSRRLARLGRVDCKHHSDRDEMLRRMPAFVEMHSSRWLDRVDAVAPFDGGVIDAAFVAMVEHLAPLGRVLLTELTLNDKPIAMYFGFVYANRYNAYRTAFEVAHKRLSPGHLMLRQMIIDFAAAGFRELDLMRGGYAYKYEYANRRSNNHRFEL